MAFGKARSALIAALPNMRVQRTRSSPSAPHSPLTRCPLGGLGAAVAAALVLGLPRPIPAAECPSQYLDKPSLIALAEAKDAASLRKVFSGIAVPDPVQRLVFAVRLQSLQPGSAADLRVIDAIPRYELEYEFLYSVTFTDVVGSELLVRICGGGWLEAAAEAILRQHRGMEAFLRLSSFNNADVAEQLGGWNSQLRNRAPKEFNRALAALPAAVRKKVFFE